MTSVLSLLFLFQQAQAVPVQLSQQGRLLDNSTSPVEGLHVLSFRIYDDFSGGNMLWSESLQVHFVSGYYAVILGANTASNPLDDDILSLYPLYVEVEIDGQGAIGLRQEIVSTPYARMSGKAHSLEGGSVDATEIDINGTPVIDSSGSWIGPAISVQWENIANIPEDFLDGDDDTLGDINCSSGEIISWNGTSWICTSDNRLSESDVEFFITNDGIDLHPNTTIDGAYPLKEGDSGTLSSLSCSHGEIPVYDDILVQWVCAVDNDTQISESQVENYVTNGIAAFDLAAGTTLNGTTIRTSADPNIHDITCQQGEILAYDTTEGWICQSFYAILDVDSDSILAWNDCNDQDATIGSNLNDRDCDGILTEDDCNDSNESSTTKANDADCDGVLTDDDCDDNNASSTIKANDADCDGVLTEDDCNDSDSSVFLIGSESSCSGIHCKEILEDGGSTGNGIYWIDPSGSNPFQVYCDMTTDDGGWTRIAHFTPYAYASWNTKNYLASISSSSFPADPTSGNWMVSFPHSNITHTEVLLNSNLNSNWAVHSKDDNGWTSAFIGTGGSYPSNQLQDANRTSWGATEIYYWWCESNGCHENLNQTTSSCSDVAIPIDDSCSGHSSAKTYISIR